MPRWLVWLISGLVVIGLGILVMVIGHEQFTISVIIAGRLLQALGVWMVIVAAVILGVRIENQSIEQRLRKIQGGLRFDSAPSPKELDHAAAVSAYLAEHPGATLDAIAAGAGLTKGQVRTGLRVIDGSGRLRGAGGGYEIVDHEPSGP